MVADEEHVAGVEDEVVDEVHEEIGDAVVQHTVLGGRVARCESAVGVGEEGVGGEEDRGSAVREGDEAAGGDAAELGGPGAEDDQLSCQVHE
uniref:Uncharacterized protein n=1 Tax=Kalanchoe fedtschenkoi TaxID=63787 RepID=A0A7N0UQ80_KALFE